MFVVMQLSIMRCPFFFFSSRRRHTRYIGDWSSDVCSSDLRQVLAHILEAQANLRRNPQPKLLLTNLLLRSEERRVGKECRHPAAAEHRKKKEQRQMSTGNRTYGDQHRSRPHKSTQR